MKKLQFQTTWGNISIKVIVASILNALRMDWRYVQYRRWTPDRKWSPRYRSQNDAEKKKTPTASFRFDNHYGNTENIYVLKKPPSPAPCNG